MRRLLDVVACTSSFGGGGGAERGAKGGGAAEKPRPGKGNATEKRKSSKSPPPPATRESGSVAIGTDTVVDGEGEASGTCPKLGSFYDFFSLAHLTPPVQCKRPKISDPAHLDNMHPLLNQISDLCVRLNDV